MGQQQTHQSDVPLGFRQVWGLCTSLFLLSSIRLFFMKPYHCVNFCYNIDLKALALLQRYWTSTDMILLVQDMSKKRIEVGVAEQIYMQPGGQQSFCPSVFSLISMDETKCLPCPFWLNQGLVTAVEADSLLIKQSPQQNSCATLQLQAMTKKINKLVLLQIIK